jgi:hypothetical protein
LLIKTIGRADLKLGPLTNMTDGGEGSSNRSEETKRKYSEKMKGKPKSPEHKQHLSEARMGQPSGTKGRTKETHEYLRILGENLHNRYIKGEVKSRKGENNANYGTVWDDDQRKNLSDWQKVHSILVTNNPKFYKNKHGKDHCCTKYLFLTYDFTGKLIFKGFIEEFSKRFKRRMSNVDKIWKGYYITKILFEKENEIQEQLTDKNILDRLAFYKLKEELSKKTGIKGLMKIPFKFRNTLEKYK